MQKSFITDHISKKQVRNKGERPVYQVKNAHDAIIDRATFAQAQEVREYAGGGLFVLPPQYLASQGTVGVVAAARGGDKPAI